MEKWDLEKLNDIVEGASLVENNVRVSEKSKRSRWQGFKCEWKYLLFIQNRGNNQSINHQSKLYCNLAVPTKAVQQKWD